MAVTYVGQEPVESLSIRIASCRICRDEPFDSRNPLPHDPHPVAVLSSTARILIASQAPGLRAHMSGVPFDDPSGDRLRQWLGVDRGAFYDASRFAILPMGFCFPGYDRKGSDLPPRRECAPVWRPEAIAAMAQAELVLAVGAYAQTWHLGPAARKSMTETVSDWRNILHGSKPATLPLPHPSWRNSGWLKRNPFFEEELLPALQERIKLLIE